jgi:hypothetical protein
MDRFLTNKLLVKNNKSTGAGYDSTRSAPDVY